MGELEAEVQDAFGADQQAGKPDRDQHHGYDGDGQIERRTGGDEGQVMSAYGGPDVQREGRRTPMQVVVR